MRLLLKMNVTCRSFLRLFAPFLLIQCSLLTPPSTDKSEEGLGIYMLFCGLDSYVLNPGGGFDQLDGTVLFKNTVYSHHSGICGGDTPPRHFYIKKCVQGQVYNSASNDCRGTGTEGNFWGAQQYVYCPANDTSCENPGNLNGYSGYDFADPVKSPAAAACASDTTAGLKWRMGEYEGNNVTDSRISLIDYNPDLPLGPYWDSMAWQNHPTLAWAYYFDSQGREDALSATETTKTTPLYVICSSIPADG